MAISSTKRTTFLYSDKDHCLAVCGSAVVSFSLQPPNPSFLEAWTRAVGLLAKSSAVPISVVSVIDSRARPPDDASKNAIRNTVDKHRRDIGTFAYVIEGHGFGAAALRSVVSLISLAARYPFPQKVFANVGDATAWMGQHIPTFSADASTAGLNAVIETMRHEVTQLAQAV